MDNLDYTIVSDNNFQTKIQSRKIGWDYDDVVKPKFIDWLNYSMGSRKCAFENCNALEFGYSEYCLRHKDGLQEDKEKKNAPKKRHEVNPDVKLINSDKNSIIDIKDEKIDESKISIGFMYGFFSTPLFLAIASLLLKDVCSVWLIFGLIIPTISYFSIRDHSSIGFALGSIVGTLVFILPWFIFTLSTDLVCYNTVMSSSC